MASSLVFAAAGCVTPAVTVTPPSLTAAPNPSTDGAYVVSWTPIAAASAYQLLENGVQSYEGPGLSHGFESKPEGAYTYSLTYCMSMLGIEACGFKPLLADVTVRVTAP